MASMAARRSSSTIVRTICRATAKSTAGRSSSSSFPLRDSNLGFRHNNNRIAPARFSLLRRELSSLKPLHTAIASSYLVSKLPTEATTSSQALYVAETIWS
ncbi:uncharacterized protein LOC107612984 isoform X2 [Arachis ipaensis]|uniref:uncharacterized protein LOC107612984 isoform X2 n=1 Tax=Arachis ipaensis TaxID=130454 RepID=UPI000A2B628E|nr:uncharacterized protein LOC107612984 isoform X2 [Arachis ipaensis]XP_025671442.1 uncharacterized protein LOC112771068 isoform X2 [Arachis hypogaea]